MFVKRGHPVKDYFEVLEGIPALVVGEYLEKKDDGAGDTSSQTAQNLGTTLGLFINNFLYASFVVILAEA